MESSLSPAQKEWVDEMGVYCLCRKKNNPLMWGHYADHFRGFCIEYTFDDAKLDKLVKVRYPKSNRRPTGNWPDDQLEFIKEAARYKAKDWCYEHEYRLVFKCGEQYYDLPAEAEMTGIIFGLHCESDDRTTIMELLGPDAQPRHLKMIPNTFDLKIEDGVYG